MHVEMKRLKCMIITMRSRVEKGIRTMVTQLMKNEKLRIGVVYEVL